MTSAEVVSITLGLVSIVVTMGVGAFAVWQARSFAQDARAAGQRAANVQREMAVSVGKLEAQTEILAGVLGRQIDRLTSHVTQTQGDSDRVLEALQTKLLAEPTPITSGIGSHQSEGDEAIQSQVDATRFAGTMNIFVRHFLDELAQLRREIAEAAESTVPVPDLHELWKHILEDSYRAFTVYLDRLNRLGDERLEAAQVLDQVKAFRDNYVSDVRPGP